MEQLASAEQLRTWLQLDGSDETSLPTNVADQALAGVSALVLRHCLRASIGTFRATEETVRLTGSGGGEMLLPGAPVLAVAELVEDPDGAATALVAGTDFDWDEHGIVERRGGVFVRRRRWYRVRFTHGFVLDEGEMAPPDVVTVVLRVAARAISNPEGLATEGVGGYNAGFAFDETRLPTLSAPDRRDLDPYRL